MKYRALELSWGTDAVFKGLHTLRVSLKEVDGEVLNLRLQLPAITLG